MTVFAMQDALQFFGESTGIAITGVVADSFYFNPEEMVAFAAKNKKSGLEIVNRFETVCTVDASVAKFEVWPLLP